MARKRSQATNGRSRLRFKGEAPRPQPRGEHAQGGLCEHSRPRPQASPPTLSSDSAFQEALFDAVADQEGAAYWEAVYGQPIHTFSPYITRSTNSVANPGKTPVIERMTDQEYTAYVRARLWERSPACLQIERQRRSQERAKQASHEKLQQAQHHHREERRARRRTRPSFHEPDEDWRGRRRVQWNDYCVRWREFLSKVNHTTASRTDLIDKPVRCDQNQVPWPVATGRAADVAQPAVERFLRAAAECSGPPSAQGERLHEILRIERVRFHPDRMTRVTGGLSEQTMKSVTAVFVILDRLWKDLGKSNAV